MQPIQQPPQKYVYQSNIQPPVPGYTSPGKKKPIALIVVLVAVVVLIGGAISLYLLISPGSDTPEEPQVKQVHEEPPDDSLPDVTYTYLNKQPEAIIEITTIDSLFPSYYRSLDSLVTFTGYCDYGEMDVMIEVEVPGFTQPFSQRVHLSRQVTKLRIVPPLILGDLELDTGKVAQIICSVTEINTGRILEQESRNIEIFSKFDILWGEYDEDGQWVRYMDDVLAWMTPDAPEILQLQRDADDYLAEITDGDLNSMIGYQSYDYFDHHYNNTWVQAVAIQGAMSDISDVRYNNSLFTMDSHQRVKLPSDTLNSRSGLCVETALVMASALQSSGMNVMLVFPPGHAQVAVEAWPNSGDYFLIETTILPMPRDIDGWNSAVMYLEKEEWYAYIENSPCYIVDAELGVKLGIRAITN